MKRMEKEMKAPLDRRNFLKLMGAFGLGLSPLALATPVRERLWGPRLASASRTRPLMGTFVTVTVLDESKQKVTEAMETAFAEMERLIPLLDRHSPGTPISYLNRTGRLIDIAPEIHEVMARAEHFYRQTYGMFDVTVKPLLDLFENHFSKTHEPPPMEEVNATLKRVGARNLSHGQTEIRFLRDGMEITLDGIAKGYIVDRAISRLKAEGIRNALINAGGDIRALGDKGHGRPWKIAIQDPRDKTRYLQIIPLQNGAVATSGNYEIYFDPKKKFHHIVDPETGLSPQTWTSASILAPSLADADALATAALIPSREIVFDVIRAVPQAQAFWVDAKGAVTRSNGWPIT
jgi:thiamine biosynthesis lipoprotein